MAALSGELVSYGAHFGHNRITVHHSFPPSVRQACRSPETQSPPADRQTLPAVLLPHWRCAGSSRSKDSRFRWPRQFLYARRLAGGVSGIAQAAINRSARSCACPVGASSASDVGSASRARAVSGSPAAASWRTRSEMTNSNLSGAVVHQSRVTCWRPAITMSRAGRDVR